MFEVLLTSFPAVIRYFYLKRRGMEISLWTMKEALLIWLVLAFLLFVMIFYFHPKSTTGVAPFRTVSIVAQTSGPVTEVNVTNGQRVEEGELLFRIEDSMQKARLQQAKARLETIRADERRAQDSVQVAQATLEQARAALKLSEIDLSNAQELLSRNVGTAETVRQLEAATAQARAAVSGAEAQLDLAQADLEQTLPRRIESAEADVEVAATALARTEVHAFTSGTVAQLGLSVGSPASQLILSPALVIIPDEAHEDPRRLVAGFSQVSRGTLYEGMFAELACDSTLNLRFRDTVIPARISSIQPAIAAGQVAPGGQLLDLDNMGPRGSVLAYFELVHPEQASFVMPGSGCTVQTYTTNLHGFFGHVIATTGVVKAVGLRLKVWGSLLAGIGLTGGGGAH